MSSSTFTIRCSVPDCEWGYQLSDSSQLDKCYEDFRKHCVALHQLDPDDTQSYIHLDFEKLLLSLWKV
jgi:hypothetical protein